MSHMYMCMSTEMRQVIQALPALASAATGTARSNIDTYESLDTVGSVIAEGERDLIIKLRMMETMMESIKLDYKSNTRVLEAIQRTQDVLKDGT